MRQPSGASLLHPATACCVQGVLAELLRRIVQYKTAGALSSSMPDPVQMDGSGSGGGSGGGMAAYAQLALGRQLTGSSTTHVAPRSGRPTGSLTGGEAEL